MRVRPEKDPRFRSTKRIPTEAVQQAYSQVIPAAVKRQAEREEQRVVSEAIAHAFANCGAKPGELVTPELASKITKLATEQMMPYLMHRAGLQSPQLTIGNHMASSSHADALPSIAEKRFDTHIARLKQRQARK